jgi:glycosyltransferase involved in cell wall biosynthesis
MTGHMRWVIDGSPLGSGRGGDETYLSTILQGMSNTCPCEAHESITVVGRHGSVPCGISGTSHITTSAKSGPTFYAHAFPTALGAHPHDAALSFTHAPARHHGPLALAVLDLSFEHLPHAYPRRTRLRLQSLIRHQVKRSASIVTISEFSRQDLIDTYDLDPSRIFVVPGASQTPLVLSQHEYALVDTWRASSGIRDRYVLYLGNLHPRKNVITALRAFALMVTEDRSLQFVIAGARWWGDDEQLVLREMGIAAANVIHTGQVTAQQREVLLREATCLVYPSLFEGFGLPPLEAMVRGVPVVASDATAMPEVLGDAAVLVDPLDERAMASALAQVVGDMGLREELVRKGHQQAAHWSVDRVGRSARHALLTTAQTPRDEGRCA